MPEPLAMQNRPSFPVPMSVIPTAQVTVSDDYLHELRVRIPVDLHRQLLSLKVLRGKSLAETVSTALDIYFADHAKRMAEASEASQE